MYSKWTRVQIQNTGLLQREEKECDRRLSLGQQHFNYIMGLVFLSPVASPFTSDRSHRLRWIARCFRTRAIIDARRRHKDGTKTAQRRSFRMPDEKKNTQTSIIVRRNLCQCTLIYSAMRRVQPEDRTVENSECSVYMIDDDRKPRECNCCMW